MEGAAAARGGRTCLADREVNDEVVVTGREEEERSVGLMMTVVGYGELAQPQQPIRSHFLNV